jgi:hypothetical protein
MTSVSSTDARFPTPPEADEVPFDALPDGPEAAHVALYSDLPLIYVAAREKRPRPGVQFTGDLPGANDVVAWVAKEGGNAGVRLDGRVVLDFDPRSARCSRCEATKAKNCAHGDPRIKHEYALDQVTYRLRGFDPRESLTTWTAGGGAHHYLQATEEQARVLRNLLRGIAGLDIKAGSGAQVVCAGSLHPNGRRYKPDMRAVFGRVSKTPSGDLVFDEPSRPSTLIRALPPLPEPQPRTPTEEPLLPSPSWGGAESGGLHNSLGRDEILALLAAADPRELVGDNDKWWRLEAGLAAACHGQPYSSEICDRFFDWCGNHPDYKDEKKLEKDIARWEELGDREDGVGAGTAVMILREISYDEISYDPESPRSRLLSPTEFGRQVSQSEPIVDGLFYRPGVTLLVGAPGVGKSYLALDLCWAIASHEKKWQGEPLYLQGRVAYLCAEGHSSVFRRLQALAKRHGRPLPDETFRLHSTDPLRLNDADNAARLMTELEAFRPSFIVVDTLAASAPGVDENAVKEVGVLLATCRALSERTGAAVVLVHHSTWSDPKKPRGSTALLGNTDGLVVVSKAKRGTFVVEAPGKMRDGDEPRAPITLAFHKVVLGMDPKREGQLLSSSVLLRAADATPAGCDRPLAQVATELAAAEGWPLANGEFVTYLQEEFGVSKPTAKRMARTIPLGVDNADPTWGVYRNKKGARFEIWRRE